jgi:DNA-binding transcriptional MerR regulator
MIVLIGMELGRQSVLRIHVFEPDKTEMSLEKIFYTIDEVSEITKLPQSLIQHYIRVKKVTLSPEHYPDINPRYMNNRLFFTQKDIDELLRFIDKRKDESWENWQLRRIQQITAESEMNKRRPPKRPDLRVIKGKKEDPENS